MVDPKEEPRITEKDGPIDTEPKLIDQEHLDTEMEFRKESIGPGNPEFILDYKPTAS